jgi:hypothetical protein
MTLNRAQRDMLISAAADASATSNILLAVTQRLVARNALSWEDVQDIFDLTLTTFEEESVRPAHPLMADVIRVARRRLEYHMSLVLGGPVDDEKRAAKIG